MIEQELWTTKVEYFRDLDKERAATLAIQRSGSSSSAADGGGGGGEGGGGGGGGGSGELAGTSKVVTENGGKGGTGSRSQEKGDGNVPQRLMETVTSLAGTGVWTLSDPTLF